MSMAENCPFLPADETRAPVWPAAARFHAFEWLRALATTDGAPEEAGIALDTWHNTAMDLQDVKAGVVPQAIARAAFNSLDKDGFRAFVNDCKKAGFTVEFPICDATPQPLIERHIAAGQHECMRAFAELSGAAGLMLAEIDTCGHEVDPAYRTTLYEAWEKSKPLLLATPQPAGAVPLPERWHEELNGMRAGARLYDMQQEWVKFDDAIRYGGAREAAALSDADKAEQYRKGWEAGQAAGRADAVPAFRQRVSEIEDAIAAPVVTEEMAARGEAARVKYMENVAADRINSMKAAITAALETPDAD